MLQPTFAILAGQSALRSTKNFDERSQLIKTTPSKDIPEITWDDITVGRLLGKGGFNNVSEVTLKSQGDKRYAVKYLRSSIMRQRSTFETGAADLVTEGLFLQYLQHENIISLHGISEGCVSQSYRNNRRFFLVLDLLSTSLDTKIIEWRSEEQKQSARLGLNSVRRLSEGPNESQKLRLYERLRSVAIPVIEAMKYLHSKNIVVRDLKPHNIGFDADGKIKLFDFGFAREISNDGKRLTGNTGSPLYMAPEVALSKHYSFSVDIYALSYILWELATLQTPFEGFSRERHAKMVLIKDVRPKVDAYCGSSRIQQLITDGWDRDPSRRPGLLEIQRVLLTETSRKLDAPNYAETPANVYAPGGWPMSPEEPLSPGVCAA